MDKVRITKGETLMGKCCRCCRPAIVKDAETDEEDADAVRAAKALLWLQRAISLEQHKDHHRCHTSRSRSRRSTLLQLSSDESM